MINKVNNEENFNNLFEVMSQVCEKNASPSDKDKAYIKIGENDHLIANIGSKAKRNKMSSVELAETVEKIIEATPPTAYTPDRVNTLIHGLETLKNRMKASQRRVPKIKLFFLSLFGYTNPIHQAITKIDRSIIILKLNILPAQMNELITKYNNLIQDNQQLVIKRNQYIESNPHLLDQLKELKDTQSADKAMSVQLKEIERLIEINDSLQQNLDLMEVIKKEIDQKKAEKDKLLALKNENIAFLPIDIKPQPVSASISEISDSLETPNEKVQMEWIKAQLGMVEEKSQRYHQYLCFQRRLLFGFSIGQRHTIRHLDKQIDFGLQDLKKMLEQGHPVINMFYVDQQLERLIPKAKKENLDTQYIQGLENLQADLRRSLPFAFKAFCIAIENVQNPEKAHESLMALSKGMHEQLMQMKPGEKLFIQTGTKSHATLLCFKKMEDGNIQPTLYNTGEGVNQHITKGITIRALSDQLHTLADKYPTSKHFPAFNLNAGSQEFSTIMTEILQMTFDQKATIRGMYTALKMHFGKAKAGPPKSIQINGICSFKVLDEAFKDSMGKKNHRLYKHHLLNLAQKEFKEITDKCEALSDRYEEMEKLIKLHRQILKDNMAEILRIEKKMKLIKPSQNKLQKPAPKLIY